MPVAVWLLCAVLGTATEAAAGPRDDGRRTMGRLPVNVGRGFLGVFHEDSLAPLLLGTAATGSASFFDQSLRASVADPGSSFGKGIETAGAWPISVAVGGLFAIGRAAPGQRFRDATYDLLDAMIVNGGYTALLKVAVGRERPNGQDSKSFPSGHSSNAFALATVLERHYGWKAGVPAYAAAAAVGYSRIVRDEHWLSDVAAGATLGYITGRAVVRMNRRPLADAARGRATWSVSPTVGRHAGGVQLAMTF